MNDGRKKKAIELRKQGLSIGEISQQLKAAKSSVSVWVRSIHLTASEMNLLRSRSHTPKAIELRRQTRLASEQLRRDTIISATYAEVGRISKRELWLIGTALYWAEGGKTKRMVRFSNGDPEMIRLIMRYFREVCNVPDEKFRGYIHIHESLNHKNAEAYWSSIAKIPLNHFYKTYRKPNPSSKGLRKTLPYGVFDVYIADVTLFLKIQGWIQALNK